MRPQVEVDQLGGALTDPGRHIVAGDDQIGTTLVLAAHDDMGVRMTGVEIERCADAFGRERLGHARRPPGRKGAGLDSQARFSRLGATLVTPGQTNPNALIRNPPAALARIQVHAAA